MNAETGQLKVTGVLLDNAQHLHTAGRDSHALVVARISTGAGLPHEAAQDLGCSHSAHIAAESKARLLRRGLTVTVICRGAMPRTDHGHAVLKLEGVTDVIAHIPPTDDAGGSARLEA